MLSGNIRIMQYFYLSVKVGREDSSNITGQKFSKIVCYYANCKHGWKQTMSVRFNNFIGEISTIHFLMSHLLSSLKAIRIFPGSTRFSSPLLYGWFHPVLSISGMDPGIFSSSGTPQLNAD